MSQGYDIAARERRDLVNAVGMEWPGWMDCCAILERREVEMSSTNAASPGEFVEAEEDRLRNIVVAIRKKFPGIQDKYFRVSCYSQWRNDKGFLIIIAHRKPPGNAKHDDLPKWVRELNKASTEGGVIHRWIFDKDATLDDLYREMVHGLIADRTLARARLAEYKTNNPPARKRR